MSIYYVLPPRPLLGQHFANYLRTVFPGLEWNLKAQNDLTSALEDSINDHPDTFVVFREDLPAEQSTFDGLVDAFGAELGDEVIEVRAGGHEGEMITNRWHISEAA